MTRPFTVLIVDDEKPAREKLRRFLSDEPDVATIYEARDGHRAAQVIQSERPDAVFLDIRMPGQNGMDVLASLPAEAMPVVVFATAYDEYAAGAFDLRADDYLLKPFDRDRFRQALDRIRRVLAAERDAHDVERLREVIRMLATGPADLPLSRIMVEADGHERLLGIGVVEYIEADRNYLRIHAPPDVYRIRVTLAEFERRLPASSFARVNRSQIVNVDHVVELTRTGHSDRNVRLRSGATLRLSRRFRDRWDEWRP